jgi:hypothetical protein
MHGVPPGVQHELTAISVQARRGFKVCVVEQWFRRISKKEGDEAGGSESSKRENAKRDQIESGARGTGG